MRSLLLACAVAPLVVLAGCQNSCQRVCVRLADYAEECGHSVSSSELTECFQQESAATADERERCRDFGDAQTMRQEWTCEDIDAYWGGPTG